MKSNLGFQPNWTSPPGDTIVDILEERDLSTIEFARHIGYTLEDANDLIQGRSAITIAVARQLEQVLGASVEFWMSRDFQYREDISRLHMNEDEWIKELPLEDMIRFGWLKPLPHSSDILVNCLHFFNVPTIQAWHEAYAGVLEMVAFRTSPSFESRPASVTAWLRQGEIEGNAIQCNSWNPELFNKSLSDIKSLTRKKDPNQFIPELQKYCASSGVAMAVVRAPTGCRASGATRFLTQEKALLLLSFRYLTDDHFWFTFFHEAGHLLLHNNKRLFLEEADNTTTNEEIEANEFAALTLIPPKFLPSLMDLPIDSREIIRFAAHLGISPGLVVGQLQHYKRIRHNQLNRLKRRFSWEK